MVASPDQEQVTTHPLWWPAVRRPAIEFAPTPLRLISGAIPDGLQGTLYRNGPGRMERSGQFTGHWFDGDGAVLAVRFARSGDQSQATATYRMVQTASYQAEEAADRWLFANYGQLAPQPWWRRVGRDLKNAANTSVLALGDRLLALWEGGWPHALDLEDLQTIGLDSLEGVLQPGESFAAHYKIDPQTGEIYNFGIVPGPRPKLMLWRFDRTGRLQRKRALSVPAVSLIHDCVLAGRYWVFCVPPIALDLLPALLNVQCFSDALRWQADCPTQIWLIDRDSLERVATIEAPPWFQWHFGNGWENSDGTLSITLARYRDFATNQHLKEVARGRITTPAQAQFVEVRLDPQGQRFLGDRVLFDRHCDFPTVAAAEVGQPSRYSYLSTHRPGFDDPEQFKQEQFGTIARHDAQTDRLTYAAIPEGCYPSEPLLIPDPAGDGRSGWILSVIYDGRQDTGEVWIWPSDHLDDDPITRLALPHPVNLGFHGTWAPA
jgi:carotenoid cleavage dioxygenase-like enzyme